MFITDDYLTKLNEFFEFKNSAPKTRENYISSLNIYMEWLLERNLHPKDVDYATIRTFLTQTKAKRNWSNRTLNYHISILRFFHLYILDKEWNPYQVPFSKFDAKIPDILSKDEAHFFIDTMPHLRTKAICSIMYGSGLRVSEARQLKYDHICRHDKTIYIAQSKSRKDRYTILSDNTLKILTEYWIKYNKPRDLLFPNRKNTGPIASATIEYQIKMHAKRLGWKKKVPTHIFRHSFATHLYDDGIDLLTIQKLLGHGSINSTTIYVHLSQVKNFDVISPIDRR